MKITLLFTFKINFRGNKHYNFPILLGGQGAKDNFYEGSDFMNRIIYKLF